MVRVRAELDWDERSAKPLEDAGGPAPEVALTRLLVVDDHAANRTILGLLLAAGDLDIHYAENGREAMEAVRVADFDIILMDMEMPVMGGLAATRAIRELEAATGRRSAAIVILSANTDAEHQAQGREAGANGHIAKPVILERLLDGIDLAIKRNQRQDG